MVCYNIVQATLERGVQVHLEMNSAQYSGQEPGLGGERCQSYMDGPNGREPALGGNRRVDLSILDELSRGLWVPAERLRRAARLIPPEMRVRYRDALLARLGQADPNARQPAPKPWQSGRDQRVRIIDSLGVVGDESVLPALIPLLRDANPEVRLAAIAALGELRCPGAVLSLCRIVGDPPPGAYVRAAAIDSLAAIRHPDALPCLIEVIEGQGHGRERRKAILALAKIGHPDAIPALTRLLRAEAEPVLRACAARALRVLLQARVEPPEPDVMWALSGALADREASVRLVCAETLAELKGPLARRMLSYALTDSDERVRAVAARVLRDLQLVPPDRPASVAQP
jgi:HEAT repeat protein